MYTVVPLLRDHPDQRPPHIYDHYARGHMLRFALFSPPNERPLLFKDHICVNHRVVSQEGDYCIYVRTFLIRVRVLVICDRNSIAMKLEEFPARAVEVASSRLHFTSLARLLQLLQQTCPALCQHYASSQHGTQYWFIIKNYY